MCSGILPACQVRQPPHPGKTTKQGEFCNAPLIPPWFELAFVQSIRTGNGDNAAFSGRSALVNLPPRRNTNETFASPNNPGFLPQKENIHVAAHSYGDGRCGGPQSVPGTGRRSAGPAAGKPDLPALGRRGLSSRSF